MTALRLLLLVAFASTPAVVAAADRPIVIASKKFTESVLLGEMGAQLMRATGAEVEHLRELGGTRVLWSGLLKGEIDVYPDYTGTLMREILRDEGLRDHAGLVAALAAKGVRATRPFGFNNTYAIGLPRARAEALGLRRISDLTEHPDLRLGFSDEFMNRADGWPGLKARYGLPQTNVRGMDHDLAYRGLESGDLDAMDVYTTDGDVAYYDLVVLEDDRGFFPVYNPLYLYRADLVDRSPAAAKALHRLEGRLDAATMTALNARAKIDKVPGAEVAAGFVEGTLGVDVEVVEEGRGARLWRHTLDHLVLVAISLLAAIATAIPLGVWAASSPAAARAVLPVVGIIQTIPSLALLVFMIPLFGIGAKPAIVALYLYSLLPIVRNTHEGLVGIPGPLRESAAALGLPPRARLWRVELPLAAGSILAGIKTSAVINVGTATLGALIGAGGYGQPILTGIRLDDLGLILEGAVPAALLAVAVQLLFDGVERLVVPRGLRLRGDDVTA